MTHLKKTLLLVAVTLLCIPAFHGIDRAVGEESTPLPPSGVTLDTIADQFEAVKFEHEMHTYIAEGCGDCHHAHNTKASHSCQSCHSLGAEIFKQSAVTAFMPCKTCHGTYDKDNPAMPGLKVAYHKKCFGCHVGIGELGASPKACAKTCHAKAAGTQGGY